MTSQDPEYTFNQASAPGCSAVINLLISSEGSAGDRLHEPWLEAKCINPEQEVAHVFPAFNQCPSFWEPFSLE